MIISKVHCFFEQSGTFKNEFRKFGITSYDYDILNHFGETDFILDLFNEINNAYSNQTSIFDTISSEDLIFAFFPCVRFENQILLSFRGEQLQDKNKDLLYKLERDLLLQEELTSFYNLITKLVIVCIKRNLRLIIENPYSSQHYLTTHWCIKPKIIDFDRTLRGDIFKKPTQYWFINCEPVYNIIFQPLIVSSTKKVINCCKVQRSLISSDYANTFIREFIL